MDLERNGLQSGHNHGPSSTSAASSTTNGYYHHNHLTPSRPTTRTGITKCMCQALYLLRFFPFAMITILFVWGFYVYSYYIIYRGYEDQLALRILLVIFFLPLYILSYWSYIRTVFGTNRAIPDLYALPDSLNLNTVSDDEINQTLEQTILARNLPVYTRSYNGYVRYCRKCNVIKPDRCHHCSTCGACIRKMDHHCHWVSNCVAYDNYKYFLLFLAYTVMLALYTAGSSAKQFIKFWKDEEYSGRFQVFFLVVFCSVFSLSILFLLSYHIYLVLKNMSTLEAYQPPRFKNAEQDHFRFNLGAGRNFRSVFGDNKLLWFLPVPSANFGDGLQFDLRLNPTPAQFDKSSQSALFTNNSSENAAIIGQQQHSLQYNQQEV